VQNVSDEIWCATWRPLAYLSLPECVCSRTQGWAKR